MPVEKTIPTEKLAAQIHGYAVQFGGAREPAPPRGGNSINAAGLNIPGAGKGIELSKDVYIPSFTQMSFLEKLAPRERDEEPQAANEAGEAETDAEAGEQAQNEKEGENGELTREEQQVVAELKVTDQKVRAHEQAHIAVGGSYILGGAVFEYEKGPDRKRYAVGGEVSIDTSEVSDNPEATIAKMQVVRAAALAPAEPSAQDRAVASAASQKEGQARVELREKRAAEAGENADGGTQNTVNGQNPAQNENSQQSRAMSDAISAYTKPADPQTSQAVINFAA